MDIVPQCHPMENAEEIMKSIGTGAEDVEVEIYLCRGGDAEFLIHTPIIQINRDRLNVTLKLNILF